MRKLTKKGKVVVATTITCLLVGALVGGAMYYDYWQANKITAHAEENAEETTGDTDKAEEVSEEEETVELLSTNELEKQEDALWSIDEWVVDKKFADVSHELGLSTLSVNPYTGADIALTRGQAAGFENALGFPMGYFEKHYADYGYDAADIKCVKQEIKASLKAAGAKVDKEDLEKMAIYTAVILKEPVYGEVWANFLKEKAQLRSGRMLADVVQSGGVYFVNDFLERCAAARGFDNLDDYLRAVNNEDVEPAGTSSFSDYWTIYNTAAKRAFVTDAVTVSSGEEQGYWYYAQGLALVALRWSSIGTVEDTATVHYVNNLSPFNNGVMGILATCTDPRESLLLRVTDKDGEVNTNIGVNLYDMSPVWYPRTKDVPQPTTTVQQDTKPQPKTEVKKVTRPQPEAGPKTSKTPKSKTKEQPKQDPTISQTPTKEKKDGEGYKDPKEDPVNQGNAPVGGGDNPVIPGEESSGPLEGDPAEDHTGSNADPKDVVPQTPTPGETDESRKDEVVDYTDENKMNYEPDNTHQSTTWTDNVTGASETYDGSKPDNNPDNTGSSNTDKSKNPVNEEPAAGEFAEPQ